MVWHKAIDLDQLPEGRTTTVTIGTASLAVSNVDGTYGAIDNACPHQGGPLGEGSIEPGVEEKCWLRCPWHGYDFDPITGESPGAHGDGVPRFDVEIRDQELWVDVPDPEPHQRTSSDVMVETMVNWGVSAVFGMVGHSNLGFADAMRRAEDRGDLRYFGIRHEGAAAFAATAFGKLTGQAAGCFAIAGPGSTNLLTGLYDAKVDRAPVLALSGQVPTKQRGRGAFQDVDLEAAFNDVAGFTASVTATADPAELMTLACKTAIVDRRVGHLVLPDDAQTLPSDQDAGGPSGRLGSRAIAPPDDVLAEATDRLADTERPVIVVGAGVRHEMDAIIELADELGAPVVTTFKAKGQIGDDHDLGCGVLGRSGTPIASWFMNESDLLLVFGASFSNHTGIAPYKPIIQVDEDPMALGRFHPVDIAVQGNGERTARALTAALAQRTDRSCVDHRAEVAERWQIWRAEKESRRHDDRGSGINAASLFAALGDAAPSDAVLCVDVGNNTYSFGRYFEAKQGQSVLMSGYLGSIGFSFPAAMGAWAAVGDSRKVISVSGDGGFGQYAMELTTAVKYDMNITHVLMNNSELGKISKEQRAAELDVWQTSLVNPDFAAMAELCGAKGVRVTDPGELGTALDEALAYDGPALVEVITDVSLL